jgi:transketolase
MDYDPADEVATRNAYGNALKRLAGRFPHLVALDAEVSNSTRAERFREACPGRFFEMFVAEQNMLGTALGLALRGKLPFVSSFAAFLTRAFDQIRMSRYSDATLKLVGSHAGVSVGEDGPSQMGLEDIAMFRTIQGAVVLYPADAVATERLVEAAASEPGIAYLRTTREATPILYGFDESFRIGGSKVLRRSDLDRATVVGAGITVHEALKAHQILAEEGIAVRVIDLYSIKPLDLDGLHEAAQETELIVTVEDHVAEGGLGEAVLGSLAGTGRAIRCLAVRKRPVSGTPEELREDQGISARAIVDAVKEGLSPGKRPQD